MGRFGNTSGTYLSVRARARAVYGYAKRNRGDAKGVTRHSAGSILDSMFGYLPVSPTPGLVCVDTEIWNFQTPIDVLTDQVHPTIYMWDETQQGAGTPLELVDTPGGACLFRTGANEGDYIMYQAPIGAASFDTPFWFEVSMIMDKALSGGFFIGVSESGGNPLVLGGIGSDDNSVGLGTLPTYVDFLKRLAYQSTKSWTGTGTEHEVMSNTRMTLGLKWVPKRPGFGDIPTEMGGTVCFYRNNYLINKQTLQYEQKPQGGLRVTFAGLTGYDGAVTFSFNRIVLITAHPQVCDETGG